MTTSDDEFKKFFPSIEKTTVGEFWESGWSTRFKGLVSAGTDSVADRRYGYRNETVSPAVNVGKQLHLQATSYVKRVKLEAFVGNVSVSSYDTWLRVYREIWHPSRKEIFTNYEKNQLKLTEEYRTPNPYLPSIRKSVEQYPDEGQGSIPNDPYALKQGQYVLLWLRWNGIGADGARTPYGALFDWYWTGFDDSRKYSVNLDHRPTNGNSKSRENKFSTIGLNSYFDAPSNTPGLYLVNYKPGGGASEARYLLRDHELDQIPVVQSSKSNQIRINTLNVENSRIRTSHGGADIGLYDDVTDKTTLAPGDFVVPNTVINTSTLSRFNYYYSQLVLKKDKKNYVIVVDQDTNEKINIHHKNIAGNISAVNLSTTGGKKIIASGSNQNYVEPNISFEKNPGPPKKWEAKVIGSNPITLAVVDGTIFSETPILGPLDEDTKWIDGYAPLENTIEARAAARANYYYILPLQKREFVTGGSGTCLCLQTDDPNPASAFTSPSNKCTTSLHFGKFLKHTVNSSRGFHNHELQDYVGAVKTMAKQSISDALVGSSFSGYILTNLRDTPTPITFSLANVDGFKGGSRSKFPSSSSTSTGSTADKTQFNTGETSSSGSSVPGDKNRPPLDWRKAITDSMKKLLQGSAIDKLTPDRLSKFLANRLSEGAPLALVKEIALESIVNAKLAVLQSGGKNKKQALKELENDPLYQSLVLAITKARKPKNTGGTDTGSTNSTDSSKQDKTIRITVFRGLPGTRGSARPTASVVGQPELVQTFSVSQDDADTGTPKFRNFVFPFVPKDVNYSGIGTQWTEIPRSGNYPIVDWTGFNLLKISFNFDIVNTNFKNKQGFGLSYSCEDQITRLREMAQTPYPVTFLNMDKFMQNEVRWPLLSSGRGVEFVIAEFSVTAVQRTGGNVVPNDSVPNQISRATCSMTLQEIPIETVEIVQMPKIVPCKKNCGGDIPTKEQQKEYLLFMAGKASV